MGVCLLFMYISRCDRSSRQGERLRAFKLKISSRGTNVRTIAFTSRHCHIKAGPTIDVEYPDSELNKLRMKDN